MTGGVCRELSRTEHPDAKLPQILLDASTHVLEVITGVRQKNGRLNCHWGLAFHYRRLLIPEFTDQPAKLPGKPSDHLMELRVLMRCRHRIAQRTVAAGLF